MVRRRTVIRVLRVVLITGGIIGVCGCATGGGASVPSSGRSITDQPSNGRVVQSAPIKKTSSGRPEVIIAGTTKKAVVDALANQMIARGYSVGQIDDYHAQFEKPGGFWLDLLLGSRFNSSAIWRVSYTLLDTQEGVRVMAEMGGVTNPGSGFEKVTEIKGGKNAAAIQSILDVVRGETGRIVVPQPTAPDTTIAR
jgi:hypothetical protein